MFRGRARYPCRFLTVVLCASLVVAPGCSLFVPWTQSVTIVPTEQKAEVSVDGQIVGVGTVTVRLARNSSHTVMARIGDRLGTNQVMYQVSTTGMLDLIGGCIFLLPFIGIVAPGFWRLDPASVPVFIPPPPSKTAS